jgi:hypothetical protein
VSLRAHLGVFVLLLALVAVYSWPLATDPAHLLPPDTDGRLFTWVMLSVFENLLTRPGLLLHGRAYYPLGSTLTFAEPLVTPALVAGPLFALTGNPVLVHALTLLLFWTASGWAMYAVAYRLTGLHLAALAAALVFTLSPPRTEYYLEFQMELCFGLPLAVFALVRFLETQRARHVLALVGWFWLQAVAVWYYAVILGLGLMAVLVQCAALGWRPWRLRALLAALAAGVALLAALGPVAWPYFRTRAELGFERGLPETALRSADAAAYLETRQTRLYRLAPAMHGGAETSLFLGVGALALAATSLAWLRPGAARGALERVLAAGTWTAVALLVAALLRGGLWRLGGPVRGPTVTAIGVGLLLVGLARHVAEGWRRRAAGGDRRGLGEREWVMILLGLALFAFLLSLGPVVHVAGVRDGSGLYAWLYPYFPPLRAIRAASRIGMLVVFAGALLAAFGARWIATRFPPRRAALVTGTALLLMLAEYASFPLQYDRVPAVARPVDLAIRADPDDVAVLEWPANVPYSDADAMFRSLAHGKRVVNGLSGFVPPFLRELSGQLTAPASPFPGAEAQQALRRIYPLRYLVVRLDDPALEPWRPLWAEVRRAAPPPLAFRGTIGAADLYEIVPLPERGARFERWVSHDFARSYPALTVAVRPLQSEPTLEEWAEVLWNGEEVRRVALDGATTIAVTLPAPRFAAAQNVVTVLHRYRRAPAARDARYAVGRTGATSPGDLRVESAGRDHGSRASVTLDSVELAPNRRGYNLVALHPSGRVLGARAFDTFRGTAEAAALADWVAALPPATIVAGAVKDEASGQLTAGAVLALRTLGVGGDLRGRFRESHAFVGAKGAPPGSAVEALDARAVQITIGRPLSGEVAELTGFRLAARAGP